ncbi:UNKNOWN [Stylonychia lemnae]|uniref:Integrator complex subunit 3 N-terminal domain-containing protein n=1 Tax=Stylonychia lemnae TaxID=5949 RepID=A0A078AHX0_STYLE|nr:UNKNOWN [Stylonychia lemnae]|eukprot:CDW80378.1 UNKNOWN [Stylonychia lemnae]
MQNFKLGPGQQATTLNAGSSSAQKQHALPSSLSTYEKFDVCTDIEIKIVSGIIFGILHQSSNPAHKSQNSPETLLAELSSITMDHYESVVDIIMSLLSVSYDYLKENTLRQIIWICENLISKAVPRLIEIFLELSRCISPILTDKKSLYINQALLDTFHKNFQWLICHPVRFASVIFFKFLRQIEEHITMDDLRDSEIALCLKIWQYKNQECYDIGRDFMRVFINVIKIPKFQPILDDLLQTIEGRPLYYHLQSMHKRPQQQYIRNDEYIRHLIPRSVEKKLHFMLTQIPLEAYQWYLKWLVDSIKVQYGTDSETIMVDIVRHIVVNMVQDDSLRQSNILPRYVLIAGIINSQKHEILTCNTLQALFIDWLFFDESQISLYEPGLLLIFKSVDKYPQLSERLIEYLYWTVHQYDETRVQEFSLSVQKVFILFEKRKLINGKITDLINNPRLQPGIQNKLKKLYTADQVISIFINKFRQLHSRPDYDKVHQQTLDNSDYTNSSPPHEEIDIKKRDYQDDNDDSLENIGSVTSMLGSKVNTISSPQYEIEDDNIMNTSQEATSENQAISEELMYNPDHDYAEPLSNQQMTIDESNGSKSSNSESSSSSSNESMSEEESDQDKIKAKDKVKQTQANIVKIDIQVPDYIVQKLLNKDILTKYLSNPSIQELKKLLDEQIKADFSEVAFIIYESLKESLSQNNLLPLTAGKKEFTPKYIQKFFIKYQRSNMNEQAVQITDSILNQSLQQMIQQCLEKLVQSFQIKLLNQIFISNLIRLFSQYVLDHEYFLQTVIIYSVPDIFNKKQLLWLRFKVFLSSSQYRHILSNRNIGLSQTHIRYQSYGQKKESVRCLLLPFKGIKISFNFTSSLHLKRFSKVRIQTFTFIDNSGQKQYDYALEMKNFFDILNEFADSAELYKEIQSAVDTSMSCISDITLTITFKKLVEEYKVNPRISDNVAFMKGLMSYLKSSNNARMQKILSEDSNFLAISSGFQ